MRECINMRENEAKAQQREAGRRKSTAKKQNDSEKNIKRTMCQTELKEKSNRDDSVTTAKKIFENVKAKCKQNLHFRDKMTFFMLPCRAERDFRGRKRGKTG